MKLTKNRLLTGGAYTILGILTTIGPQTIFAVCDAMDGKFMKCHWTAQAEIGNGAIIALLGFLLFLSSHKIRVGLQIALLLLSVQTILLPNILILWEERKRRKPSNAMIAPFPISACAVQ